LRKAEAPPAASGEWGLHVSEGRLLLHFERFAELLLDEIAERAARFRGRRDRLFRRGSGLRLRSRRGLGGLGRSRSRRLATFRARLLGGRSGLRVGATGDDTTIDGVD